MAEKHKHHYVANGQKTVGPDGNGKMITYTFLKCDAPGTCNKMHKMKIRRWKAKK